MAGERTTDYAGTVLSAGKAVRYAFLVFGGLLLVHIAGHLWVVKIVEGPITAEVVAWIRRIEAVGIGVMIAVLLSLLVNVVLFLIWQYRAARAVTLRADIATPPISPGWHVGWWFIPIANIVMPAVALGQLYRASVEGPDRRWSDAPFPSIVLGWWLLMIAGWALNRFALLQEETATTIEAAVDATWLAIVAAVSNLFALALILKIVRTVCTCQAAWPNPKGASDVPAAAPAGAEPTPGEGGAMMDRPTA